ncbi:MAG: hypothetical protein K2X29_11090, partial [Candidatus Obscuribacterales bacterium]|nr:hypothetical protein [Candidatus Obscuribacterales bacterium]
PTATKVEKKLVIKAIDDLGRHVTPADVATKTGLPILATTATLNQVATETGGHLEVAKTGDVAYRFNFGFQNAYLAKGFMRVLQMIGEKTFQIAFFLLRISFGIMLVLSFLIVIGLIIVIMLRGGGSDDRDRGRGGGISFDFFDYMILRDLFWWGNQSTWQRDRYRQDKRMVRKGNFLLDCFSFLFGDGNPNYDLEERRWATIAEVIRNNEGVVTAEQMAPFTGTNPKNEDGVLPVLVRFNGKPEVTEAGNIVYVFPSMQVSTKGELHENTKPIYLKEKDWKFTEAPADSLIPVYLLAGFNFFGSMWLWSYIAHSVEFYPLLPLINFLVVYGTFFVGVPLVRWLGQLWLNQRINARNKTRQEYAAQVSSPSAELKTKLLEAKEFQIQSQRVSSKDAIYTTEKELLDQSFEP